MQSTLRILHVLDHSIPLHSGYSFRTRSILREQAKLGWETFTLTSPKHTANCGAEETIDGIQFYRTAWKPGIIGRLPVLNQFSLMKATERRLLGVASQIRPQVIHAHSPVLNALPAIRVGRKLGIPVVYEVRAFWEDAAVDHGSTKEGSLRYRLTRMLETYALRRVAHVFTICNGLRNEMATRGIEAEKITIIPNAVESDTFVFGGEPDQALRAELGLEGKIVLGFIGSFYGYEGLGLVIDSMKEIEQAVPEIRLLLVGGGPQEKSLKEQVERLGLQKSVLFTGRIPHGEVQRYYSLVDILTYPRKSMRLTDLVTPLKPLEAMAQGQLVIASDVGGHRELIRDNETGILFRADDKDAFMSAVVRLLAQRERWDAMRQAGLHYVQSERNWACSVANYAPVYHRLSRK